MIEIKWRLIVKTRNDIIKLIEEEDVEFIRLQFTDVFGNLKNLAVTPGQLERVFDNKYVFDGSVLFDNACGYKGDLYLYPDLDSFVILPWRPQQGKVGKFICDVYNADGTPFSMSPRTILKNVLAEAEKKGYTFYVDPECEFFLFQTSENGTPTTLTYESAGYMDVGPIDFGENARRDIVLNLEEMGFEVESSLHEKAPGQHQIAFKEAEALQICDSIMTFKFAVRSIAKRFGLYATFMPKPKAGEAGSGMHFNISVYKDGKNILHDRKHKDEMSNEARHFVGGIMAHAQGACAITNPIVNSYKRILNGFEAPFSVCWTEQNENALIRVRDYFGEKKIDLRFPDASSNPYLALAICLAAGLKGIEEKADPGKDMTKMKPSLAHSRRLPENLKEAITAFKKDSFMKEVLGKELVDIYYQAKLNEWNDYMKQVSDWEIDRYLIKM